MEITKKHNSAHPTRSGRNGNIDLMRFVFCLIIILYHINNRLDLNPPFGLFEKFTDKKLHTFKTEKTA